MFEKINSMRWIMLANEFQSLSGDKTPLNTLLASLDIILTYRNMYQSEDFTTISVELKNLTLRYIKIPYKDIENFLRPGIQFCNWLHQPVVNNKT